MKKHFLVILISMLAVWQNAFADYDFSAVAPSGQTLYYRYIDGISGNSVRVIYPSSTYLSPYSGFIEPTGVLTIPDSVSNGSNTYSVTSIGSYAFRTCTGLTSVIIPNSIINIGEYAFYDCTGLTSIFIGDYVTSIGYYAFSGCTALLSVIIPNSVTDIDWYTFSGCTGLTSVTIGNAVSSIGEYSFYGCTGLTSVSIGNTVTSICSNAFYGCASLVALTIPTSVTSIGENAFRDCTGLTSITIGSSVSSIGRRAFCYCISLTSVTIPNSVTFIGSDAFWCCSALSSVIIPNTVTNIGNGAFTNVRHIEYHGTATGGPWGAISMNGVMEDDFVYADNTKQDLLAYLGSGGNVTIPSTVNTIGDKSFYLCADLTSVTIPDSVTSIGELAFASCTGLTSISIPSSVISIGESAFWGCTGLTSIISYAETAPSLIGNDVFSGVNSNIDVYIPCGSMTSYGSSWSYFINLIEPPIVIMDVTSADESMGNVDVLTQPICQLSTVIIQATAVYGYHFTQWDDGNTDNPRTIMMTQDTQFIAMFAINQFAVIGTANDNNRGIVTGNDTVNYLDSVTLTATASYGYHFARWNDYNTNNPRTVIATDNIDLIAMFDYNEYTITLSTDTSIHGTVNGDGIYNYLSEQTISANAYYGYHFTQWDDGNTDNPRTITLTQDTQFVAMFAKNTYTLVFQSNNSNIGEVDTTSVSGEYLDTSILVYATTTAPHYHFVYWSDYNSDNPRRFVFYDNRTYTAYFAIDTHTVSVQTNDISRGMVETTGTEFVYGTPCTVTATAYSGYTFARWSNGVTYNPYTFAVIQDTNLTAIFEEMQGIDDVNIDNIVIQAYDGHITVLGTEGVDVRVYDMMGRKVAYSNTSDEHDIPIQTAGVYLVKIGNHPPRKVVVIR